MGNRFRDFLHNKNRNGDLRESRGNIQERKMRRTPVSKNSDIKKESVSNKRRVKMFEDDYDEMDYDDVEFEEELHESSRDIYEDTEPKLKKRNNSILNESENLIGFLHDKLYQVFYKFGMTGLEYIQDIMVETINEMGNSGKKVVERTQRVNEPKVVREDVNSKKRSRGDVRYRTKQKRRVVEREKQEFKPKENRPLTYEEKLINLASGGLQLIEEEESKFKTNKNLETPKNIRQEDIEEDTFIDDEEYEEHDKLDYDKTFNYSEETHGFEPQDGIFGGMDMSSIASALEMVEKESKEQTKEKLKLKEGKEKKGGVKSPPKSPKPDLKPSGQKVKKEEETKNEIIDEEEQEKQS